MRHDFQSALCCAQDQSSGEVEVIYKVRFVAWIYHTSLLQPITGADWIDLRVFSSRHLSNPGTPKNTDSACIQDFVLYSATWACKHHKRASKGFFCSLHSSALLFYQHTRFFCFPHPPLLCVFVPLPTCQLLAETHTHTFCLTKAAMKM